MESVVIGTVGDANVGKTLLAVSYTANYVYKEYEPTVLNCHWTNVVVNGDVIDLRIWDNSGSDDYTELRPLSYPQTDVFLMCFSLKNRVSFDNIGRKWVPEVKRHVRDMEFLLVGCKRDDCLKTDDVTNDVVTTDEGEAMATRLGALGYVETSAIEQSGFTSCFNKATRFHLDAELASAMFQKFLDKRQEAAVYIVSTIYM